MISRVILLSALILWSIASLLPPAAPAPLTTHQLMAKARLKSVTKVCVKTKLKPAAKKLCQKRGMVNT